MKLESCRIINRRQPARTDRATWRAGVRSSVLVGSEISLGKPDTRPKRRPTGAPLIETTNSMNKKEPFLVVSYLSNECAVAYRRVIDRSRIETTRSLYCFYTSTAVLVCQVESRSLRVRAKSSYYAVQAQSSHLACPGFAQHNIPDN